MVVGDKMPFPKRTSYYITSFFRSCDMDFQHDRQTTKWRWVLDVLLKLDEGVCSHPDLPSDQLLRVFKELLNPISFLKAEKDIDEALDELNKWLNLRGLGATLDGTNTCRIRNLGSGTMSSSNRSETRPLTSGELAQRKKVADFLESASEDDFTEHLLVPLFRRLGFHRVTATGHKEKLLEFGKDLWMKFQLPTGHWIYFCAQIKRDKLDSSASGGSKNVANVLAQANMAIGHPIFDSDANRTVLVDHVFVISAGEITRAAKEWIGSHLNAEKRRHIIFMDRDEFLDHAARILIDLNLEDVPLELDLDDVPF